MNKLIPLFPLLLLGATQLPIAAQFLDADKEIALRLQTLATGEKILSWTGQENNTFFIQAAHDLNEWTWAPNIETGIAGPMSYEVDGPTDKGFFRLVRTNQTAADPDTADFDGDQLTNLEEITPRPRPGGVNGYALLNPDIQTNPLDSDTDHDGLNDKWEEDHGLDPTDDGSRNGSNGTDGDSDYDGLTNEAELRLGTNPLLADTDGDGLPDEWEIRYGLNPASPSEAAGLADRHGHLDEDAAHNLLEFLGGTNPKDPLEYPPTLSTLSRTSFQSFTVPADPQDDSWGSVSAGPYSEWNNAPAGFYEEITAPIPSASIGPFLASKITFPTEIPYYSFDFLVEPMKLEPPSRFNFYGKNPTEEGGTQLFTELHQSRCWLEISPKQISATAQKISVLHISSYWSTNSSFVPPAVFPPDTSNPPWIPFAAKVIQFEFPPGQSFSSPLDMDQQLIGGGENISVTSSSYLENVTVKWRAIEGSANVSDHLDPWSQQVNGMRIFPCHKNPADTEMRNKLEVIVKAPVSLKGQPVFVKAYDVDDTTSEEFDRAGDGTTNPIIDIHGKAGNDNFPDYLETSQAGMFWTGSAWGGSTAQGVVDENGEAKFIFRVGMQPGNNYRVVASVIDQKMFEGVQVTDPSASGFLGTDFLQSGGAPATPLLTVWRRLWVENDSMEAIPVDSFGYKRNDLSWHLSPPLIRHVSFQPAAGTTSFGIHAVIDQSSFLTLQNGRMIVQSVNHSVIGTVAGSVTVAGDHSTVPLGSGFRLYDDDDAGLAVEPLPRTDLVNQQMQNYFKTAFLEVKDFGDYNIQKYVSFLPNEDVFSIFTTLNDKKEQNISDKNSLWVCHLIAAYQGPMDSDIDPSGSNESIRLGETADHGGISHSAVYVENCRETYHGVITGTTGDQARIRLNKWIVATASHEMGHQPGTQSEEEDHEEGKLMSASTDDVSTVFPEKAVFSPQTILRFRKSNRWSE